MSKEESEKRIKKDLNEAKDSLSSAADKVKETSKEFAKEKLDSITEVANDTASHIESKKEDVKKKIDNL